MMTMTSGNFAWGDPPLMQNPNAEPDHLQKALKIIPPKRKEEPPLLSVPFWNTFLNRSTRLLYGDCLSLQSCSTKFLIVFGVLLAFTWNLSQDRFLNTLNPITEARIIHVILPAMLWFLRRGCYRSQRSQLTVLHLVQWADGQKVTQSVHTHPSRRCFASAGIADCIQKAS